MLTASQDDQAAIAIAQHYANKLGSDFAVKFFTMQSSVTSKCEAEYLVRFYWNMVDQAAEDQEQGVIVEGVSDLQFWMEKLMNIVLGYLKRVGMADVWNDVSDQVNGR